MAMLVEGYPVGVFVQGFEGVESPVAPVGFKEGVVFDRGESMGFCEDFGGFAGALDGAGEDHIDGSAVEELGEAFGLCSAFFVERDVRGAARESVM